MKVTSGLVGRTNSALQNIPKDWLGERFSLIVNHLGCETHRPILQDNLEYSSEYNSEYNPEEYFIFTETGEADFDSNMTTIEDIASAITFFTFVPAINWAQTYGRLSAARPITIVCSRNKNKIHVEFEYEFHIHQSERESRELLDISNTEFV